MHKAAEGIVADAADKSALSAEAGNPYRDVGRRAAWTLQQPPSALRQQVHHRISDHPNFCVHAHLTSLLNYIKPV